MINNPFDGCTNWSIRENETSESTAEDCTNIMEGNCKNKHATAQKSSLGNYLILGKLKENKGISILIIIHVVKVWHIVSILWLNERIVYAEVEACMHGGI